MADFSICSTVNSTRNFIPTHSDEGLAYVSQTGDLGDQFLRRKQVLGLQSYFRLLIAEEYPGFVFKNSLRSLLLSLAREARSRIILDRVILSACLSLGAVIVGWRRSSSARVFTMLDAGTTLIILQCLHLLCIIELMIYEKQQESSKEESQCSECEREQIMRQAKDNQEATSSDEDDGPQVIPVTQVHRVGGKHYHGSISNLRREVDDIASRNHQKDMVIKQLIDQINYHDVQWQEKQPIPIPKINASRKSMQQQMFSPRSRQIIGDALPAEVQLRIANLEAQVRETQIENLQLQSQVQEQNRDLEWMERFALRFIGMTEELSEHCGEPLHVKRMPLRQKTKVCWKAMKHLVAEYMSE